MTTAIKRRRGTTTQHSTFTGLEGEITVDTTKDTLVVHDGATAGGFALLREDLSNNTNVITTTNTKTLTNKTFSDNPVFSAGTANGVAYLNGSKVLTTGSALTFDGATFGVSGTNGTAFVASTGTGIARTAYSNTNNIFYVGVDNAAGSGYGAANCGILYSVSNPIAFFTNASEQMRLTSTGLGIGTSSPGNKLVVIASDSLNAGAAATLIRQNGSAGNNGLIVDVTNTPSAYVADFRIGNSSVMRLDQSGNLGLGVTPSAWGSAFKALELPGGSINSNSTTNVGLSANAYRGASSWVYNTSNAAALYQVLNTGAHAWNIAPSGTAGNAISFTQAMTLDASGRLGIGISSPSYRLHINNAGTGVAAIVASDGTTSDFFVYPGVSSGVCRIGPDTGAMSLYTAGTERMRIDSSGNVGIGTSSPSQKLDVRGSAYYGNARVYIDGNSEQYNLRLAYNNTTSGVYLGSPSANAFAITDNAGTERMRIDSSGNLLVGTTNTGVPNSNSFCLRNDGLEIISHINGTASGSGYALYGYNGATIGSITQNGTTAVAYNTSSDYRLKENIQPMQNALDVVAQLNPVTYTWKADGSDGQGFIAHELQAVVPDCVTGEKDAVDAEGKPVYQGIDTSFLVATLTKAIQEQQEQINQLKAEVAALKGA